MSMEIPSHYASHSDRNPEPKNRVLFKLLVIGVALLIALSWGLSWLSGAIVAWLPPSVERQLGAAIAPLYESQAKASPAQDKLNQLLDQLEAKLPATQRQHHQYQALLIEEKTVNAAAIPGDRLLIYRGLLDDVGSENELMMILGHELGHFAHRDHLRSLGRSLLLNIGFSVLLGDAGAWVGLARDATQQIAQAQFSQGQEREADEFGLQLLQAHYGHVGGATDFFERLNNRGDGEAIAFLASHPAPRQRVTHLKEQIAQAGYSANPLTPLPKTLTVKPQPKP